MKILGISGSLRAARYALRSWPSPSGSRPRGSESPFRTAFVVSRCSIPTSNRLPPPVAEFREQIIAADALLIASPEYAHGVPGALKNALDWMVGNDSFVDKPVGVLGISPRSVHAHDALREVLRTMSAQVVDDSCLLLPVLGFGVGLGDPSIPLDIRAPLLAALEALRHESQGRSR